MRVVIDTNVMLSGLYFGGVPLHIIELVDTGHLTPCYSKETWEELAAVLLRKKFVRERKILSFSVAQFLDRLKEHSRFVSLPDAKPNMVPDDPADNYIIAVAIRCGARFIISGDAHLLHLGIVDSIPVLTPQQFLETL